MKNIITYAMGAVIALLSFTTYQGCRNNNELSEKYFNLKQQNIVLTQNDSIAEGVISSAINDLHTAESLIEEIRGEKEEVTEQNKKLLKQIEALQLENQEIRGNVKVEYVYEEVTDTLYQPVEKLKWTNFYYPQKEDWTVRHRLWIQSDSVRFSHWKFNPIEFDMVISEDDAGIYTGTIVGPDFLRIGNLKIDSRPITPEFVKIDQFDWLLGGGYRLDKEFNFYGGVRLKKSHIFIGIGSDKVFSFNYMQGL